MPRFHSRTIGSQLLEQRRRECDVEPLGLEHAQAVVSDASVAQKPPTDRVSWHAHRVPSLLRSPDFRSCSNVMTRSSSIHAFRASVTAARRSLSERTRIDFGDCQWKESSSDIKSNAGSWCETSFRMLTTRRAFEIASRTSSVSSPNSRIGRRRAVRPWLRGSAFERETDRSQPCTRHQPRFHRAVPGQR